MFGILEYALHSTGESTQQHWKPHDLSQKYKSTFGRLHDTCTFHINHNFTVTVVQQLASYACPYIYTYSYMHIKILVDLSPYTTYMTPRPNNKKANTKAKPIGVLLNYKQKINQLATNYN